MALSILEQIIALIVTAIEGVTTGNGYQVDVTGVYRPSTLGGQDRDSPGSYDVQLARGVLVRNEEIDLLGNPPRQGWTVPVEIDCLYRPSSSNTDPIERELDTFWSEVSKAVMTDIQWGGLAIDSELGAPNDWIDMDDGTCGKTGVLNVHYRVQETNPYAQ